MATRLKPAALCLIVVWTGACRHTGGDDRIVKYPPTRTGDVVEDYHGTKVADPYRWMEDLSSSEVADWVTAQNQVTETHLN